MWRAYFSHIADSGAPLEPLSHAHRYSAKTSDELPANWSDFPAAPQAEAVGDEWVGSAESPFLRVPSAVVPLKHMLVLNPNHPDQRDL